MKYRVAAVSAFFLLLPAAAYANMGTPLMWFGMLHLVVGNTLIGVAEGLLIAKAFKRRRAVCIPVMIAANYTSAWVGWMLLPFIGSPVIEAIPTDFHNVRFVVTTALATAYVLTLILEWPFVALCFVKTTRWFRKSLVATLLVQTASYAVLFGLYSLISANSLVTDLDLVELEELTPPDNALVIYISIEDGDVYSLPLTGGKETRIADLNSSSRRDRMYVTPSVDGEDTWDLMAMLEDEEWHLGTSTVRRHCPWQGADEWRDMTEMHWLLATQREVGPVPKLGNAAESPVDFQTRFWPIEGLVADETDTGKSFYVALETPFAAWFIRHATQLPGDFVVAQIDEQICLIDYHGRKVAVIARGRGPVTVLTGPE